jgi:hypothetical protein
MEPICADDRIKSFEPHPLGKSQNLAPANACATGEGALAQPANQISSSIWSQLALVAALLPRMWYVKDPIHVCIGNGTDAMAGEYYKKMHQDDSLHVVMRWVGINDVRFSTRERKRTTPVISVR